MASQVEKELERIERELDAKTQWGKPPAKRPTRVGGNAGPPDRSHFDAVIVGAVLLEAIAFINMLGESLSQTQKAQITAASMGGAVGLLVGYGVGRIKY